MYKNKTASLDDLHHIGPKKPIGYKLLYDLEKLSKVDPAEIELQLQDRGMMTLILTGDDCSMSGGALYAWDNAALSSLLNINKAVLNKHNWPTDTEGFIRHLAIEWAREKTQVFDIIADAFGNKDHPGRTDRKAADYVGRFKEP